jgi:hypothetical protein
MKVSGNVMALSGSLIATMGALMLARIDFWPHDLALFRGFLAVIFGVCLIAMGYAKSLHEKEAGEARRQRPPGDTAG